MKIIIICLFVIASYHVKSQKHYSSIQEGSKYSLEQIASAINQANWCGYYHEIENFEILFDDGTRVFLKSKNQLIGEGFEMIDSCNKSVKIASKHIYSIAKNGVIVIRVDRDLKKKKINRK
ncbi:MAG: hypothetical protein QNL10_02340 [Crocinitomicaceae bacterium]|tara:strand:+ start:12078 stop:12440 length:363 start_codon:yes stop_codon:yes gene_type:complete